MTNRQLLDLGLTQAILPIAYEGIRAAARDGQSATLAAVVAAVVADPASHVSHPHFGALANALVRSSGPDTSPGVRDVPVPYHVWGDIDDQTRAQLETACRLPVAVAAACMPDSHLGYGLSIGGVLATDNAVVPYGVGVDIACRMRASLIELPVTEMTADPSRFRDALECGTMFGMGGRWDTPKNHRVMDADWSITAITRTMKDKAWNQLGTSGSGNHFVEFGTVTLEKPDLGLPAGVYLCLLSHSGSRGTGAAVCKTYTDIAVGKLSDKLKATPGFDKNLAWLDLDSEAGQEYWLAMNLMGDYAAANHETIHNTVLGLLGAQAVCVIENHHNFAWKEVHGGREVIVHRKGATPAGEGVMGVIPGSMATPGYIVRGRGKPESLASASHGAGRRMSRTQARKSFDKNAWNEELRRRGVTLLSGGLDEMPDAYKPIDVVMAAQADLVEIVARFDPKIVKMADDGTSED